MSNVRYMEKLLDGVEVEWKALGDIGDFVRGKRFVKTDIISEGFPCIHYGEMYTHYGIWATKSKSFIDIELASKLRVANHGDVVIVATGETIEDIGNGTAWLGENDVVIHDACFSYKSELNPKYVSYFLSTSLFKEQIKKNVSSGKISAINANGLSKAIIPIPPPDVQAEIVRILDAFTALTAELTAELTAREKQYTYYRDQLLTFAEGEVEWKALGEVGEILRGTAITEKETNPGEFPVVANGPSHNYYHDKSNRSGETIVIARSGAYAGLVSYWNKPIFLTDAFSIHPENKVLSTKFLYYVLKKDQIKIHLMGKGAGVPHVRAKDFESYKIPAPPLEEQARIVAILDKFETLTNSISEGLPCEIELRQQQYEYYREQLLSFPKVTGEA